ncbi:LuxR C-terminal-related transcriptional regulator [Streptomyces olivoreticuli]
MRKASEERQLLLSFRDVNLLARAGAMALSRTDYKKPMVHLTEQQLEILIAIANGESVPMTARRLRVSPNTIRTHRRMAYHQLGVHNAGHAVAVAMAVGLITPAHLFLHTPRSPLDNRLN